MEHSQPYDVSASTATWLSLNMRVRVGFVRLVRSLLDRWLSNLFRRGAASNIFEDDQVHSSKAHIGDTVNLKIRVYLKRSINRDTETASFPIE